MADDENMDVPPSQSQDQTTSSELCISSVSPPRDRQSNTSPSCVYPSPAWRSSTPPPPAPFFPIRSSAVATPTKSETTGGANTSFPRTLSSPSLMDSSPKPKGNTPSPPLSFLGKKAHELTPITCNTSGNGNGGGYIDDNHVVSPDDALFGEHLALPSDLGDHNRKAPAMPQFISGRAKSVGNIAAEHFNMVAHMNSQQTQEEEEEEEGYLVPPVKFPSDRKYYSFTCQNQFVQETAATMGLPSLLSQQQQQGHLKPYQPTPRESVGDFTGEQLDRIFFDRQQPGGQEADPIPVDRQWSIPSIHLANHLNGGGSTTDYTDEEDDLDNISWSSRGNSLYMPDDEDIGEGILRLNVGVPNYDSDENKDNDADEEEEEEEPKKQRAKKESPLDWLKSVESDGLYEAASSKFLTSGTRIPQNLRRSYLRHQSSVEEDHRLDDDTL